MKIDTTILPIAKIEKNVGQIEGLPGNPRFIRDKAFDKLVKSIKENPEMLYLRELLVYPYNGKYVIIGGNMRFEAMSRIGLTEAPCKIIPAETSIEDLKAYTIKDNAGYGEWNFDFLANEWDEDLLSDCCITIPTELDSADEEEESKQGNETEEEPEHRCSPGDIWQLGDSKYVVGENTHDGDYLINQWERYTHHKATKIN